MVNLRSVGSIREKHIFANDLRSIPAVEWMTPEETKNYDESFKRNTDRLGTVDKHIEDIIRKPDEDMRIALGEANYLGRAAYVKELKFHSFLPQGKVQIQRDIIKKLVTMSRGKSLNDVNQEIGSIKFQAEWEINPKIGILSIDDKEKELRLRDSLGLFSGYLNCCEHEFYKQMINVQLDEILHRYHMLLEFRGEKIDHTKSFDEDIPYYFKDTLNRIYYSRARDYLTECGEMWNFLDGSEYTKRYLLEMKDVHPSLRKLSIEKNNFTQR